MASQDHGIHANNVCQKEVIAFISTHKKREEYGSNWRSSSHYSKKIPQAMRNMKNLILVIWIRNDDVMNEEDDEVEGSIRSLPTKQIKISIQLSFHDIVLLYIWLYSVDLFFVLMIVYY